MALAIVVLHTLANGQYGFHRDELMTVDNARHLAWGYVEYPPLTALVGRVELELFGTSLRGFRFFPALAAGLVLVLTGLSARELGGKRRALLVAAVAATISGTLLFDGSFLSYEIFDYLSWVVVAYLVIRLLKSDDPRWWVAIGAAIGVGMMTKFTMGFLVAGVVAGVVLTPARRYLRSPWLWCGAAVAVLVWLPNLMWQVQHHFVTLEFVKSIHARDVRWGRANGFLLDQFWSCNNPVTLPLWAGGLWYLFSTPAARRYRMVGWMYVVPLVAYLATKGRGYYLAPAYPMLLAAGAVWGEQWVSLLSAPSALTVKRTTWRTLAWAGLIAAAVTIPLAPVNSTWWRVADSMNGNFNHEIGYREMVATVAKVRDTLPVKQRARLGIFAGDVGEAGAINLYGPAYGLPQAISWMNSYWLRGYGDPPPETLIVVGMHRDLLDQNFESCELVNHLTNPWGITNNAIDGYADVFLCRHLRQPWPDFWRHFQSYG
jgi:4-amino-4-deoxy-L-arabinose transferase-like glycosyltransferase